MSADKMPPLPGWHWHSGKYTDNQMHAYARAYAAEQTRELVEALEALLEASDSMCGTFGCILGETPEHEDTHTHDKWAEDFLKERTAEARATLANASGGTA